MQIKLDYFSISAFRNWRCKLIYSCTIYIYMYQFLLYLVEKITTIMKIMNYENYSYTFE